MTPTEDTEPSSGPWRAASPNTASKHVDAVARNGDDYKAVPVRILNGVLTPNQSDFLTQEDALHAMEAWDRHHEDTFDLDSWPEVQAVVDTEPSTEGPWFVQQQWEDHGESYFCVVTERYGRPIAKCYETFDAEQVAAALNAAGPSPEVQAVVEAAKAWRQTWDHRDHPNGDVRNIIAAVDALLAKETTTDG
jgi:hypothetical protein